MGIFDLIGDRSYSTSKQPAYPSHPIPQPDVSKLSKKDAKKLLDKWLQTNREIAFYNSIDKIMELGAFLALFAGQMGAYSTLDIFKHRVEHIAPVGATVPSAQYPAAFWVTWEPKWTEIAATSALLTALTYMAKDTPAGIALPITGIISLIGYDALTKFF